MITTDIVRHPRRAACWCDQSVEIVFFQSAVKGVLRNLLAQCERIEVSLVGERAFGLGFQHPFLTKERHYRRGVLFVKRDDIGHGLNRCT